MSEPVIDLIGEKATVLLTVDEFAQLFKVSRTTVFTWMKTGIVQEGVDFIRMGRILRFRYQVELLFRKKSKTGVKQATKKRPTKPEKTKSSYDSAVNLDYGLLPV